MGDSEPPCSGSGSILGLFLSFPAPFYSQHHLDTVIQPTEQLRLCFLRRKGSSILPSDPLFLRPCALRISLLGLKAMPRSRREIPRPHPRFASFEHRARRDAVPPRSFFTSSQRKIFAWCLSPSPPRPPALISQLMKEKYTSVRKGILSLGEPREQTCLPSKQSPGLSRR